MSSRSDLPTNPELIADAKLYLQDQFDRVAPESTLAQSWDEFHRVYDTIIQRFAIKAGVPSRDLDECAQEVWTAVISQLGAFEHDPGRGRFRSWLYRIVRNKAADLVRSRIRRQSVSLNDSRVEIDLPVQSMKPEGLDQWDSEMIDVVLSDLKTRVSAESYDIFYLRRFEEISTADVAKQLQMSDNAVRTCCHRVQRQFRRLMERYTGEEPGEMTEE